MRTFIAVAILCVLLATCEVAAQARNRCVECHFANFTRVPAAGQLAAWDRSAHARAGTTCDRCHGGDPTTYQPVDAHRGVLNSRNPLSRVNAANLPLTCAPCHAGVVASFRASAHGAMLAAESGRVPNCTACHGVMATRIPSPQTLEATCARCHDASNVDDAALMRTRIEAVHELRQTLASLEPAIAGIEDRAKRSLLAAELLLARSAVRNATDALHTLDWRAADDQRAIAQRRASELVTELLKDR